jgi:hypothetical protein
MLPWGFSAQANASYERNFLSWLLSEITMRAVLSTYDLGCRSLSDLSYPSPDRCRWNRDMERPL